MVLKDLICWRHQWGKREPKWVRQLGRLDFYVDLFANLNVSQARRKKGLVFGMFMEHYMKYLKHVSQRHLHSLQKCFGLVLTGVAQWVEQHLANHTVGTCPGCGPGPWLGACKRQKIGGFPLISVCLPSLPCRKSR